MQLGIFYDSVGWAEESKDNFMSRMDRGGGGMWFGGRDELKTGRVGEKDVRNGLSVRFIFKW